MFAALAIPMSAAIIRLTFPRDELLWPFAAYTVCTGTAAIGALVISGPIKYWFGW